MLKVLFCDKTTTKVDDRRTANFCDDSSSVDADFADICGRSDESSSAFADGDTFQFDRWKSLLRPIVQR